MKYKAMVKTGVRRPEGVEVGEDGVLTVITRSKPIDGAANNAVVSLLADYFDVAKSNVRIISGIKSKIKIIEIL